MISDNSKRLLAALAALSACSLASSQTAAETTITLGTTNLGPTPSMVGYNLGHWTTGSNVIDWWRYTGARYARVFLPKKAAEWKDDNWDASLVDKNFGDGVTNLTQFEERRLAMRANPKAGYGSPSGTPRHKRSPFADWTKFETRLKSALPYDSLNQMNPDSALGELRSEGVDVLIQLTASWSQNQPASWDGNLENTFPTASSSDWAGYWEIWQHYYVVAYLLADWHGVSRYSVFNEPNHEGANGITVDEWLRRVRIASDAVQSAIADYNRDRAAGKPALTPTIYAPTTTVALGTVYTNWGLPALDDRNNHINGSFDAAWNNFHVYSYQPYGKNHTQYEYQISTMRTNLANEVGTNPRMPIANTEFGVLHIGDMQGTTSTLDSQDLFVPFGRILHELQETGLDQMFLYKFGATKSAGTGEYPINKLGTHYVQNTSSYNYGGITRVGEIYRLFNRAVTPATVGQIVQRRQLTKGSALGSVDAFATYDPSTQTHYVFSVNYGTTPVALRYDVSALNIQHENRITIQEVSTTCHGGVRALTRVNQGVISPPDAVQPAQSVWLATIPGRPQSFRWPEANPVRSFAATHDATLRDGAYRQSNYAGQSTLRVRSDSLTQEGREVAVIRFDVAAAELASLSQALLVLDAASTATSAAQAHVYGMVGDNFTEGGATWETKAQLRQNHPAGALIANNVVLGQGTTTKFLGQIVASSTTTEEKRIDVTEFVRQNAGAPLCFLVVQDKRWDTSQEGKAIGEVVENQGDTQPAGLTITSREAGDTGPRLRVTRY